MHIVRLVLCADVILKDAYSEQSVYDILETLNKLSKRYVKMCGLF